MENKLYGDNSGKTISELRSEVWDRIEPADIVGKNGRIIHLSKGDMLTVDLLKDLTVKAIVSLLGISNYDIRCYLSDYRSFLITQVRSLLKKQYVYRESGDEVDWDYLFLYPGGPTVTFTEIRRAMRRRDRNLTYSDERLEDIIKFLTDQFSEVRSI